MNSDLVPLREMVSSGSNNPSMARNRSDSITKETPERWRFRLWPSKAITSFCRTITRCQPPESSPGVRLGFNQNGGQHKRHTDQGDLKPHWRVNELTTVPTVFNSAVDHSSVFFLLAVEECREAVTKAEDPEHFGSDTAGFNKRGGNDPKNGWIDGEITAIIAESEFAGLPKACDPRLGSVWVIAAAISATAGETGIGAGSGQGGKSKFNSGDLSGGDLMVLHSPHWSHPLLGIIQPWDPDYDIKFGINFSVNQSTYISTQQPTGREGNTSVPSGVQVVNILVCVDQSNGTAAADIGGWASQGSIVTGVRFSMTIIGTSCYLINVKLESFYSQRRLFYIYFIFF